MLSISRRLRKINFLEEVENLEHSGPPEIDDILPGIPHESTTPIKIICKFCYILSKIHMIVICYQYMQRCAFPTCRAQCRHATNSGGLSKCKWKLQKLMKLAPQPISLWKDKLIIIYILLSCSCFRLTFMKELTILISNVKQIIIFKCHSAICTLHQIVSR
jgi:hypothetical protein